MRSLLFAGFVLATITTPFSAQAVEKSARWSGFYFGVNAGAAWSDFKTASEGSEFVNIPQFGPNAGFIALGSAASSSTDLSVRGFIGGAQAGYNYELYNSFVVGVEADIQGVAGSRSEHTSALIPWGSPIVFEETDTKADLKYIGTVRGRIGVLLTPDILAYGTGGLAYGKGDLSLAQQVGPINAGIDSTSASASDTRVGWTAGGGVEWLMSRYLSLKAECLRYDLGSQNFTLTQRDIAGHVPIFTNLLKTSTEGEFARVGLNYHFD
jgi:outer membrane immunogenic protein